MKGMFRWLREYDRMRTNSDGPNELWHSTKYDLEGLSWDEIREIYIPELDCNSTRKSWYAYKRVRKDGGRRQILLTA